MWMIITITYYILTLKSNIKDKSKTSVQCFWRNNMRCSLYSLIVKTDIAYADGSTPFSYSSNLEVAIRKLESDTNLIFNSLNNSFVKSNADEYDMLTNF